MGSVSVRDFCMKAGLEEEKMREGRADKDPFKPRKVHRIVSKWMLPEPVRRTYLERANCLPPPVFIICVSIAEVNVPGGGHWRKDSWGAADTLGLQLTPGGKTGEHMKRAWGGKHSAHRARLCPLQSPLPGSSCLPRTCSQVLSFIFQTTPLPSSDHNRSGFISF